MENKQTYHIIKVVTNICRFVLAAVFVFSGFVKAIDPLGTLYKIQDYMVALGVPEFIPSYIVFLFAVLLGCLEFCLGTYLFFGIRRRLSTHLVLFIMSIMTPLTLWLALDNPISDCGCFGDALVLSNWETFWKNVVLMVAACVLFKWNRRITPLLSVRFDWLAGLYSWIYILLMAGYCIWYLPVFDFRPYHIGANIREGMEIPEGKTPTLYETRFILQKDGVEKEFGLEDYPDSTWTFVDSKTVVKKKGYEPAIQDFEIMLLEDGRDITHEILENSDYTFLLVAHRLDEADDSSIDLINELYDYSVENGYAFWGVTSSPDDEIIRWQERTGAEYPFALADNITLKTMIRSNPGLLLLKQGVVINKWSVNELPDEYQLTDRLENLPLGQLKKDSLLNKLAWVLAWYVFPFVIMCVIDRIWGHRIRHNRLRITEN